MGYRIEYAPLKTIRDREKITARVPVMTGLFLLLFCFLVFSLWPEGGTLLRELLIPGDPDVTVVALETFAEDLRNGESVSDAFASFCRRIQTEENLDYH